MKIIFNCEQYSMMLVNCQVFARQWAHLNGYMLTWLPLLSVTDPYPVRAGRTVPVRFTLTDFQGEFALHVGH